MNKFKLLFITAVLLSLVVGCNNGKTTATKESKTLYQEILERKTLKVGYISYPPSFIVNSDGTYSGIFYEVMQKIGENLGLKIEYVQEVTWDGMIETMNSGKVDMIVTGIWPTSQRGKLADFCNPLFYSVVKAYTYSGNNKFDNNLISINESNVRISCIDGEMTSIIADMDFPKAKRNDVTQMTGVAQTLLEVKDKKADITFVEPIIALEFLEKNPNSIQEVKGIKPLRVFPNSMMVPKNEEALKSTLNIAINELINSGFVDRVIDKYEKYPNCYSRVQLPYKQ